MAVRYAKRSLLALCALTFLAAFVNYREATSRALNRNTRDGHVTYNIQSSLGQRRKRQESLQTSSSYDFWWPYPAGGVPSSTTMSVSDTADSVLSTANVIGTLDAPLSTLDISSTATLTDSTISVGATSTSSGLSGVSSTGSLSTPLTTVSALPPTPDGASARPSYRFEPTILLPVFAGLGVICASASGWLCCSKLHARKQRKEMQGECVAGPRYGPAAGDEKEGEEEEQAYWAGETHKVEKEKTEGSSWIRRVIDKAYNGSSFKPKKEKTNKFTWPPVTPKNYAYQVGNAFDPESDSEEGHCQFHGARPDSSSDAKEKEPLTYQEPATLLVVEDDMEEDITQQEAGKQRSVRCSLLERVGLRNAFGSLRDSKVTRTPKMEDGFASPGLSIVDAYMDSACSTPSARGSGGGTFRRVTSGHKRMHSDISIHDVISDDHEEEKGLIGTKASESNGSQVERIWQPWSGFRIVADNEDEELRTGKTPSRGRSAHSIQTSTLTPESGEMPMPRSGSWLSTLASAIPLSRSSSSKDEEDIYTPMPRRKTRSKSRPVSPVDVPRRATSRSTSPATSPGTREKSKPRLPNSPTRSPTRIPTRSPPRPRTIPRVDSSVLPASPPVITSPPLETNLFFAGSSPTKSPAATTGSPTARTQSSRPMASRKTSRLPVRTMTSASPPRDQAKNIPYQTPVKATRTISQPAADGSPKRPASPAERHAARRDALTKVEAIISRSYSERELANAGGKKGHATLVPSPSIAETDETDVGTGILQRLEGW